MASYVLKAATVLLIISIILISCKEESGTISMLSDSEEGGGGGGGGATPTQIYIFPGGTSNGNLGGRTGADSRCVSAKSASYSGLACTNIRAFISVSAADDIEDMPANYSFPTNIPIVGPTDLELAPDWPTLLTGTLTRTIDAAGIVGSAFGWWTGSAANGSYETGEACSGWTSNGAVLSRNGSTYQTTSQRFYFNTMWCSDTTVQTLCACW